MTPRNELRTSALRQRDALPQEERRAMSETIAHSLESLLEERHTRVIHCYISFRSEVQTRDFINRALERGLRVIVPVVEELDGAQFLVHTEIHHLDNLQHGRFGLEEPVERTKAELHELDAVIVPLAAFDNEGNRLGYGKGFYDKFMSQLPPNVLRIGLAFRTQQAAHISAESHDVRLDIVITEKGIVRCTKEPRIA